MNVTEIVTTLASVAGLIGGGFSFLQWLRSPVRDLEARIAAIERELQEERVRAAAEGAALVEARAVLARLDERLHRLVEGRNGHS